MRLRRRQIVESSAVACAVSAQSISELPLGQRTLQREESRWNLFLCWLVSHARSRRRVGRRFSVDDVYAGRVKAVAAARSTRLRPIHFIAAAGTNRGPNLLWRNMRLLQICNVWQAKFLQTTDCTDATDRGAHSLTACVRAPSRVGFGGSPKHTGQ